MDGYKLAVELTLVGNLSQGLDAIAKQMLGISNLSKKIGENAMAWRTAIGGAAMAFGGYEMLKGLGAVAAKGEDLIHQQNVMLRNGLQLNEVLNLTTKAFDEVTKAIPTATASEVLRTVTELRSVVGDTQKALAAAPISLQAEAVLHNLTGKDASGEGFALWRAMEMKGITASDPEGTQKLMMALLQDISGSGGKLTAGTYQALAKTGGAAYIHATPEFLAGPMSVVAADLGGDRAGTALMTLYQLISGATTMSKQQYEVLKAANLIDQSKVTVDKGGRINAEPGAILGSTQYSGDLYGWTQFIKPNLEKLAGNDPATFESLLAKIGRNRNATKLLTMFTDEGFMAQIAKDMEIWKNSQPLGKAYDTMLGRNGAPPDQADYKATMEALHKQMESFWEAVGGPAAKAAIPALQQLTSVFNSLGSFANAHPEAIKYASEGILALGTAMAALGGAAVVAGAVAIAGPVAAGIAAVGASVAVLAAMNWEGARAAMAGIGEAFQGVILKIPEAANSAVIGATSAITAAMSSIASAMSDGIASIPSKVMSAISGMAAGIAAAIGNALKGAVGGMGPSGGRRDPSSSGEYFPGAYHGGGIGSHMQSARLGLPGPRLSTASLVPPPSGPRVVELTGDFNADGVKLGRVAARGIVRDNRAVNSAAGHDGRESWAPPDVSFA